MRPRTIPDWIAFVLLLIGAFAWAAFVTDVNVLDRALEPIADPLDDIVFVLIGLAGLYWIIRVITGERSHQH
ncbi:MULTISPECIES: DUF378 domain-containing protein [Nocardiaceae]|uniref:DUF378 domain-containing protein n=1 Tax=Rhodococcus triatomae TaxID=300028 RepID=A0A1G8MML0_9NOCA|nr:MULTISPECIES: DUF378 domain-containing protein [Nocardiaceae]AVH20091.1 DUF378 domain-containing protein [Nocardia cyriacigeorgica]MBF6137732.1 DUF378 domain-containing protein [Nocardia otitidiscaviarum]MBF6485253.1 DUF378 domain-containing protein [Nocardia otitidiscaviarum]PPJ13753.1 DUF378 domain-containing protein [Nocardia cyriacigeorgica]QNG19035.1 DUF378 domain-containing protein [Rhodococcus triatomae]